MRSRFEKSVSRKAAFSFCFQPTAFAASGEFPTERVLNPWEGISIQRGKVKFEKLSIPHWREMRLGWDLAMDRRSMRWILVRGCFTANWTWKADYL